MNEPNEQPSCRAIIGAACIEASNRIINLPSTKGIFEVSTNISFSKNLRSIWALRHVLMRDMQRAIYFFGMCNYYTAKFSFRHRHFDFASLC